MTERTMTIGHTMILTLLLVLAARPAHPNEACDCFPHPSDWADVDEHGLYVLNNGANPYCTECHGTDLKGGWTGVSCTSCHAPYPHEGDWSEASVHGGYALTHKYEVNCLGSCHGEDGRGGYSQISCYSCHELFPHGSFWSDPDQASSNDYHGQFVLDHDAIDNRTCATQCHGSNYAGGLSGSSCFDCHKVYPHGFNWSRPDIHGPKALSEGVTESCGGDVSCHGVSYDGGVTEIACFDCHENFPHESNIDDAHQSMSADEAYQCSSLCHGGTLTGGSSGSDCTTCHSPIVWPLYHLLASPFESFLYHVTIDE